MSIAVNNHNGHLVQTGVPYDMGRRIGIGTARNNTVGGVMTVAQAFEFIQGKGTYKELSAKEWVAEAHRAADEMVEVFHDMIHEVQKTGTGFNLDRYPGTFKECAPKTRTEIMTRLSTLWIPITHGEGQDDLKDLAWKTCKALYLPGFLWVGQFGVRNNKGALETSGLFCVDFDKIPTKIEPFCALLEKDPLIFGYGVSPSGTGVKVIVKIPGEAGKEPDKFTATFETFERYVAENYPGVDVVADDVAKGIGQLCFFLSDPKAACFEDSHVLIPDEDLLAARIKRVPRAKTASVASGPDRFKLDERKTALKNRTAARVDFEPMKGWDAARQWEAVKSATDALMDNYDRVPDATGERNKFWTQLGYAYSTWTAQLDDETIAEEARNYLLEQAEAHYGGSIQVVQNALDNGNGSITLGTLFECARAYADWTGPWTRKRHFEQGDEILDQIGPASANGEATFHIFTVDEIAKASDQPPPFIIQGILPEKGLMTRAGRAKSFKTWDALELCLNIALGGTWHDRELKTGPAVYFNLELSPQMLLYRVKTLCQAMGIKDWQEIKGQFFAIDINPRAVRHQLNELVPPEAQRDNHGLYTGVMVGEMIKAVEQAKAQPVFCCVDSFYKFTGDLDENSAGHVTQAYAYLHKLAKELGSAIDLIHHFAKGSPGEKMTGERSAGSRVHRQEPDAYCEFSPLKEKDCVAVHFDLRAYASIADYGCRFTFPNVVKDESLNPSDLLAPPGKKPGPAPAAELNDFVSLLAGGPLPQKLWQAKSELELGIKRGAFYKYRNKALDNGLVEGRGTTFSLVIKGK